jgi:hypothetical protein
MKKRLLHLFAFLLPVCGLLAQDSLKAIGKVVYLRAVDLPGEPPSDGPCALYFNAERSLFVLESGYGYDGKYHPNWGKGDTTGFPILKLHREKIQLFVLNTPQYRAKKQPQTVVADTLGDMVWTPVAESGRQLGGLDCEKATGHYRGRDYEAWYAPDIPIPSGPYKFGGLPGLILEMRSTDGKVQFVFDRVELSASIAKKIALPVPTSPPYLSYKTCKADEQKFYDDLVKDAAAKGTIMVIGPAEGIEWEQK